MNGSAEMQAWVARAEEDYVVATSALKRQRPLVVTSCFHAQQCAEKYLKAILVAKGRPFPRTHDLRLLNTLCGEAGVWIEVDVVRLDSLSFYAVQARYPGDEPTLEQSHDGLKTARAVRRFARKWMGLAD
jgi:HEPN domain-containing protein